MRWLIACVVIMHWINAHGQHVLSGKILDADTRVGIAHASVFAVELNASAVSDSDGNFQLPKLPAGKFMLQVSHVAYQDAVLIVSIPVGSAITVELQPSSIDINEVVVTGTLLSASEESIYNISQLDATDIRQSGSLSLTDAMSRLPGVSQLTTGAGISKPVIRGLYGNRIQVNVNGIRFDNQQWQDEHGLGLSDIGVDRIEIIRGPASVLYGSDAMGGVVNIIDERPAALNSVETDRTVKLFSNTYGLSFNYGRKKTIENRWKKFRIGFDNHADYGDGRNDRVLNSRFASYNVKASWGRQRSKSMHQTSLIASSALFGFVFDSLSRKPWDARLSRRFDGPHHSVSFVQANSENTWFHGKRKIKLNGGWISNLRLEDEGGGGISLSMLLNTLNVVGQVNRPIGQSLDLTYGSNLMFQTNTNFGGRIIIPNAWTGEISAFSFFHLDKKNAILEGGIRYDQKFIETFATRNLNVIGNESPVQSIIPFFRPYNALNVSAGGTVRLAPSVFWKLNASTGYRPGNLAELSSNGLHEGSLRWEVGLPDAKIEQNLNVETSLHLHFNSLRASVSGYRNAFRNFFYLAPTGREYYGFLIYEFRQSDALLSGGEAEFEFSPVDSRVGVTSSYSFINAKKSDGSYLPFIPANRLKGELRGRVGALGSLKLVMMKIGLTYVLDQTLPAQFETSTGNYVLIDLGLTAERKNARFSLTCTNLFNRYYYDHLSRFKYYGIANMGRNIVLTVNF